MVDYSKWDRLDLGDSDSVGEEEKAQEQRLTPFTREVVDRIATDGEDRGGGSLSSPNQPGEGTAGQEEGEGKRYYNHERTLRSQRSQQRRLEKNVATKLCEHCGADDVHYKLRICTGCNLALYCSPACQEAASGSHRRICDIIAQLPSGDADRLALKYNKDRMVDLDAGLRYGKKYMGNLKHLEINVEDLMEDDYVKISAKQLSSLLMSKEGALDSVFWLSGGAAVPGITANGCEVWKELLGLKQLRLSHMTFDVQLIHDVICQQKDTLVVLCLSFLDIGWHKAKCRRTLAAAVNSCKHLVKLNVNCGMLMDSDLKIMLNGLPNLRILHLKRYTEDRHEFTDNTCGLIARKCPGLQELDLDNHDHISVRGIRKIFEGCVHLRSFLTTTSNLSGDNVRNLLQIAPQLLCLSLDKVCAAHEDLDKMIEATGGRTLFRFGFGDEAYFHELEVGLSAETKETYDGQIDLICKIEGKREDPEVANEWEDMFESTA